MSSAPICSDRDWLPQVIGILNVTPDSFSDGGLWFESAAAYEHGMTMASSGADWVEVGGESTRPGARRTPEADERQRVVPVVRRLSAAGVSVAVDTMRSSVAAEALDAGATMINDVSGGQADPNMLPIIAEAGVPYISMHWRGHSLTMRDKASYADPTAEVFAELQQRIVAALDAGIVAENLIIDPGLGFAKTANQSWQLLRNFANFHQLGYPVLLGASRKIFLGKLLADQDGAPRPPLGRDDATTALSMYAYLAGAWGVRVHNPIASRDTILVARQLYRDDRSSCLTERDQIGLDQSP